MKTPIARNFLDKTIGYMGDDCVIWPFSRNNKGYGEIRVNHKKYYAHRFICEIVHGEAPTAIHHASHLCGNGHKGCMNPRHLAWKTPSENEADKIIHGTKSVGQKQGRSKLTDDQILKIREMARTYTQDEIAHQFGVMQPIISRIIHRKNWSHV